MNHYRVIEGEEGLGVLQKQVHSGGVSRWDDDMNIPHPINDVASKKYVDNSIAGAINSIEIDEQNSGDITVSYKDPGNSNE